jgi:hypothetical protein
MIELVLAEAETDCEDHTLKVRVGVKTPPLAPAFDEEVVAGLLRWLAQCTDGRCATRDAKTAHLMGQGMVFHFTSDLKRDEFRQMLVAYLPNALRQRLTFKKI